MARRWIKPGDLIGFSGRAWESALINLLTYGIPRHHISHVGIIGEYYDELVVFESNQLDMPCLVQKKISQGVQAAWIEDRLRYDGKLWHYPLTRQLYPHEATRLNSFLLSRIGTNYDMRGAVRAAGLAWSWWKSLFHPEDLSSLFCSELCAAAHSHVGLLRTTNVSRWSPNRLIRYERHRGILHRPQRLTCENLSSLLPY